MSQAALLQETIRQEYSPPFETEDARETGWVEKAPEWDDVTTQFAELVDGSMRTEFKFGLDPDGSDLIGRDGRGMREISGKSLKEARTEAAKNPNLAWNLRRTILEDDEVAEVVAMANGEGPNTKVVASDFVRELWDAKEDFGGYNVTRKQTMLRIYTRNADGTVSMITQTLDRSDRQGLEAIYTNLGQEPPKEGELLGQRISIELTAEEQSTLDKRLTGVYDRELAEQHGGKWYAGRRPADYRNTYEFVCGQKDIIATCIELERSGELTEDTLYDMAATMQQRFENQVPGKVTSVIPKMETVNRVSLSREMTKAGQAARASGKSFSACGGTLSSKGGSASTEEQMKEAGFGSMLDGTNKWHGGKIHRNSKCVSCKDVKREVGACRICKDCVDDPKQRKAETKKRQNQRREDAAHRVRLDRVARRPS